MKKPSFLIFNKFNFQQEIILENGRKKANNTDNIIYLMSNQGFEGNKEKMFSQEDLDSIIEKK